MKAADLFAAFEGTWLLSRTITHNKTKASLGSLAGKATFSLINKYTYHYKEEGELNIEGQKYPAFKEYLYLYNERENQIEKHYAKDHNDEGLFYLLNISNQNEDIAKGKHICGNDTYLATYEFSKKENLLEKFKLRYEVKGPEKDYIIESSFKK